MPTFDYRAEDLQGRRCKGRVEADSPRHARQLAARARLAAQRTG